MCFFVCFCVSFIVQYTVALTEIASCSVRYCTVTVLYILIFVVLNSYHQLHAQFVCCLSLWVVSISNFYRCQLDYYQRIVNKKNYRNFVDIHKRHSLDGYLFSANSRTYSKTRIYLIVHFTKNVRFAPSQFSTDVTTEA